MKTRNIERRAAASTVQSVAGAAVGMFGLLRSTKGLQVLSFAALLSASMLPAVVMAGEETGSDDGGGCGDCEEEPNDTGDGEVCQEDDCDDCNSGGGESGNKEQDGQISTGDKPVVWETGEKWEHEVDFTIKLKGKDFPLIRKYSSDPQLFNTPYNARSRTDQRVSLVGRQINIGKGWAFGNLRAATAHTFVYCKNFGVCGNPPIIGNFEVKYGETKVQVLRAGRKPREYTIPADPDIYALSMKDQPGNQRVSILNGPGFSVDMGGSTDTDCGCGDPTIDSGAGKISGIVKFEEPGRWTQEYALFQGFGYISLDTDEYGNTRIYSDTDGDNLPDWIWLNGSSTDWNSTERAEAWVKLIWETASGGAQKRLKRVEAYRPKSGDLDGVMTQYVNYHHLVDTGSGMVVEYHDGTNYVTSNATPSLDIGADGDLVQVVTYKETDPDDGVDEWQAKVKQYRYHDPNVLYTPAQGEYDIRLDTTGGFHELKMVINQQQIEFAAQQSSTLGSPIDSSVVELAQAFLSLDDDVAAYTGAPLYTIASKIISYDTSISIPAGDIHPVKRQFILAEGCGCGSSGATSAVMLDYERFDWARDFGTSGPPPITNIIPGKSMHIHEYAVTDFGIDPSVANDPYRTIAHDLLMLGPDNDKPYPWINATVDRATGDAWVNRKLYDYEDRVVKGRVLPSGHLSYTLAIGSTPPNYTTAATGNGYVEKYSYGDTENVGQTKIGGVGQTALTYETVYRTDEEYREHLPEKTINYRVAGSTNPNDQEVIEFEYGFDGDSAKLLWQKTIAERELSSENGPSGSGNTSATWDFFDNQGLLIWSIDADSSLTRFEYDDLTGAIAKVVRNADPTNYSTEIASLNSLVASENPFPTTATVDAELITQYDRDILGRLTKITRPGGVERWIERSMMEDVDRPGILYFGKTLLPHLVSSSSGSNTFSGPAVVSMYDVAGDAIRSSTFEIDSSASYDPDTTATTLSTTELSRSAVIHDLSGAVDQRKRWLRIGEASEETHTTTYSYDAYGRMKSVTDAEGTTSAYTYDVLDRVITTGIGTLGSTANIAEYFYDGDPAATTPSQGVGNGNLTVIKLYDGEGSPRISRMYYDERDRGIATLTPDAPMSLTKYDNLDRPIESASYPEQSSIPLLGTIQSSVASSSLPDAFGGLDRSWYTLTDYSQRGFAWQQRIAIDPSDSLSEYLSWYSWYDVDGNELAAWSPNAPMTLYSYDEHDRVSAVYVSDRLDEATNTLDFDSATSLVGDTILEQAEYTYNYATGGGVLEMLKTQMRAHDSIGSGALTDSESITSYMGLIYDNALRRVATVNFGTNKSGFSSGTSTAPTLSNYDTLAELRSATDVLFSWNTFNTRGMVEDVVAIQSGTTAADEIRTRYQYDDLYRTIAVIENYDNATLAWDATEGRYAVSGLDYTDPSADRVTSFVHDMVSKVTKRVAHIPGDPSGETVQVTEYEYGTTAGSSATVMDSLISSNNLLSRVKYPDEATGEAGASAKYYVDYAYNQLGELRGVTDQNQTVRAFERDLQGRVLADIVDTLGTYLVNGVSRNVDGAIRRIGYEYDSLGRMTGSTSHTSTASSGNIRDEVEIGYTPLWQVETVAQQHDGEVNGSSPIVKYVYANADANGAEDNYSRLSELQYPKDVELSQGTVQYNYSGIDDRLSRITGMDVLGLNHTAPGGVPIFEDLVNYERIGLGMMAKTSVNVGSVGSWDVVQDRTLNHDGTNTTGAYPSFDRFGRVISHMWVRDDFGAYTGSNPGYGGANQPAIMEATHTYDRSSNRTSYNDNRVGAKLPDRNRSFKYDRLNRLTEEMRTPIPVGSVYTSQHASNQWNLDVLGNWDTKTDDADHDGSFNDLEGVNYLDDREHNQANEIESGLQYDQRLFSSGTTPTFYDHHYDDTGNMTDERKGKALSIGGSLMAGQVHTYDAWNRLVKTEYLTTLGASTTISENTYNALGWRTSKVFDTTEGAYDGLDQKRLYLYGADWRLLEERIDIDVTTDSGTNTVLDDDADWISQQFWGIRYIDDAVGKRIDRDGDGNWQDSDTTHWYQITDTQFSVGVVLDGNGFAYERIDYNAYGVANHRYAGDASGDGVHNFFDISNMFGIYTVSDAGYHADYDVNFDGNVDLTDLNLITALNTSGAVPDGWISDPNSDTGPDNSIGYAGYVFNHEREDYSVRFRVYDPGLGRWMTRDPIGYLGGWNLYGYAEGLPTIYNDPLGLAEQSLSDQIKKVNDLRKKTKNACDRAKLNLLLAAANILNAAMTAVDEHVEAKDSLKRVQDLMKLIKDKRFGSGDFKDALGKLGVADDLIQKLLDNPEDFGDLLDATTGIAGRIPLMGQIYKLYAEAYKNAKAVVGRFARNSLRRDSNFLSLFEYGPGYSSYYRYIWGMRWAEKLLKDINEPSLKALQDDIKKHCCNKN